jgi:hypothetical protein
VAFRAAHFARAGRAIPAWGRTRGSGSPPIAPSNRGERRLEAAGAGRAAFPTAQQNVRKLRGLSQERWEALVNLIDANGNSTPLDDICQLLDLDAQRQEVLRLNNPQVVGLKELWSLAGAGRRSPRRPWPGSIRPREHLNERRLTLTVPRSVSAQSNPPSVAIGDDSLVPEEFKIATVSLKLPLVTWEALLDSLDPDTYAILMDGAWIKQLQLAFWPRPIASVEQPQFWHGPRQTSGVSLA